MSENGSKKRTLPPGFKESDFKSVNIEKIREVPRGIEFTIQGRMEKDPGVTYTYRLTEGSFRILANNEELRTPGGNIVKTPSEAVAAKTAEHMNLYGEDYAFMPSIATFLYSYIDFAENTDKEELDNVILGDLSIDWTFDCPYCNAKEEEKWLKVFGGQDERIEKFEAWLKRLSKAQTIAVILTGGWLNSVNTGYILANPEHGMGPEEFVLYYDNCYNDAHTHQGFYESYPVEQLPYFFKNFSFWFENMK